jgi:hypothetical protein
MSRAASAVIAVVLLGLAACGGDSDEPSEGTASVVGVTADSLFPSESLTDVVTYADQVAVFTVVSEKDGTPEGESEPYIPRVVTVHIDSNIWTTPNLRSTTPEIADGTGVEFVTWGSQTGGDTERKLTAYGEPRLEVGSTYVAALFTSRSELGKYPGTVALLADKQTIALGNDGGSLLTRLGIESVEDLASQLRDAQPDPRAASLTSLDPADRVLAIQSAA